MNITKQKGLITELQCEIAFSSLGIVLSKPIVEDCRYDYIADLNGKLIKIQCKTCSVGEKNNYIQFATRSTQVNSKKAKSKVYTKDEIDYFYTFYDGISYLVPVNECSTCKKLRFNKSDKTNVNMATDYELKHILQTKEEFTHYQYNQINVITDNVHNNICVDCGQIITYQSTRCVECERNHRRILLNNQYPTRDELMKLLVEKPILQIAKQYNVSDKCIRKLCQRYDLPYKKEEIIRMKAKDN